MVEDCNSQITNLFTQIESYVDRKVTGLPKVPVNEKNRLEQKDREEISEAFARLIDLRVNGILTDDSLQEYYLQTAEPTRNAFIKSLVDVIDKFKH
jgi:Ca2+-binding EF-hand superfamily protein